MNHFLEFIQHHFATLTCPTFTSHYHSHLYSQLQRSVKEIQQTMTMNIPSAVQIEKTIPTLQIPLSLRLYQLCKKANLLDFHFPTFSKPLNQRDMEKCQYLMEKHFETIRQKATLLAESNEEIAHILTFINTYESFYGYFIPINTQYEFERNDIYTSHVTATYQQYTVNIDFYNLNGNLDPSFVRDVLTRIFALGVMGQVCREMNFMIYLSPLQKQRIIHQGQCWTSLQINSGCTFRHQCGVITVWRQEELYKTLCHEMIHSFGWDSQIDHDYQLSNHIQKEIRFAEKGHILLHEAYTETWATLLNVYLCSIMSPSSSIEQMIQNEQKFILFQVAKVLQASGIPSMKSLLHQESSLCQTTNVFSYFIIKSALLWNVSWFMKTFQNGVFHENKKITSRQFWDHILSILHHKSYQQTIQNILSHHDFTTQNKINKTMRMTITECMR